MQDIFDQIRAAESAKSRALAGLHIELGYSSPQELAAAIIVAAAPAKRATKSASVAAGAAALPGAAVGRAASAGKAAFAGKAASAAGPVARSGRGGRIDEETKRQALAAVKAGEQGTEVAKRFGVSYPTIQNWKVEAGLVKHRRKKLNKK